MIKVSEDNKSSEIGIEYQIEVACQKSTSLDVSETVDGDGKADAPKGQEFGIPVAWAYTEQMYDCHQFLMGRYHLVF